jgi:putative peptidoglycan lipid II flippase
MVSPDHDTDFNAVDAATKRKIFNSALAISLLTLVGYLGFFTRDIIMVRWFGVGDDVDIFFLGSMIPMLFVAVFSIPAGIAIVPKYSELRNPGDSSASIRLACVTALSLTLFMAILSVLLYFLAPWIFSALNWHYSPDKLAAVHSVLNTYLLIMLLSGLVVVANAALNAEGLLVLPAALQLFVPVVVILALLLFGASHRIYAAVYGMLLGQFVNLAVLAYMLWAKGLLVAVRLELKSALRSFPFRQYVVLVAAALSAALIVPSANSIAAHMPSGSVAIIGLGTKVIMLITGVLGMGMATVLLPYFSSLVAKSHHGKAQSDLSFFLLLASFISVPTALILRLLAGPMTSIMMANSVMTSDDVNQLIRTIQYGVAQLPFFVCGLIAIKYITAYQRTGVIFLTSFIGLIVTIVLGTSIARYIGVSGISLAVTISMAITTTILIFYASHLKHLPISQSFFLVLNWLVFVALFIFLHYHMISELIFSGAIYILLCVSSWKKLVAEWGSKDEPGLPHVA